MVVCNLWASSGYSYGRDKVLSLQMVISNLGEWPLVDIAMAEIDILCNNLVKLT